MSGQAGKQLSANSDQYDFLVFGSGAAGLMAALAAAHHGWRVCLCEKTDQLGGTTATSGGTIWVPGNEPGRRLAEPDSLDKTRQYMDGEIGARDGALREAFFEGVSGALAFLAQHSAVRLIANNPYPDYHSDRPGAALSGRALTPAPLDGRRLGSYFRHVRPPIPEYMVLGGMMVGRNEIPAMTRPWSSWASFQQASGLVLRYLGDRLAYPRGTRLYLGNALVAALVLGLREKGCEIRLNTSLVELSVAGDRVTGAVVVADGARRTLSASRGVLVATGGFAADREMRDQIVARTEVVHSATFNGCSGDGIRAATAIGAVLDTAHDSPAFWMPVSTLRRADGSLCVYPHIRDRPKPGLIAVNRAGRRFVNESASYHDVCMAMLDTSGAPNTPAWLICDQRFLNVYGIGMIPPVWRNLSHYVAAGYLQAAASIEDLARRIGVDPLRLRDTVAEHNHYAETGVDLEFGKGSTAYNRFNGDSANKPNPCLAPIRTPPFYAVEVTPAPIGTSVGLATDIDGRVARADGTVIDGLYAGGNDMSSLMRGRYPGPGITLGPHIAFAWRTVQHALGAKHRAGV